MSRDEHDSFGERPDRVVGDEPEPRRHAPRLPRGNDIIASVASHRPHRGSVEDDLFYDSGDGDGADDPDGDWDVNEQQESLHKNGRGKGGRRRIDKRTPRQRRRRRIIVRSILGVFAFIFLIIGWVLEQALSAPGNSSAPAKIAEWGRGHDLGWAVTWLENKQYEASPPKVGGSLSASQLQALAPPTAAPPLAKGQAVLPPIKPFLAYPVPGEGTWTPAVVINGIPVIQTAKLRSDPDHTSYLSAVAWIDQKHATFALHAGLSEPGGSGWASTDHITAAQKPGLIATWNGAFRVSNGDSKGGFFQNGKTTGTLVPGQASEVFKKDGSIAIGKWGTDVTMTPDVVGVRQNLGLLVDNGQVNPTVNSSDKNLWGVTVSNKFFVWRSGVGITADGDLVYGMGPTLSVQTLADLLQRAGAVRAMELDINMEWVSFMTYDGSKDPNNPVPTNLLDFKRTPSRYFSADDRDFVAVYAH